MLRAKMTVEEPTKVSVGGGSPKDGTYYVGRATKAGVARERCLPDGGVSSTADAYLFRAHTAHCCEHLGRLRGVPDMGPLPADPVVVCAGMQRHAGLLGREVLKAIPTAPHAS